MINCQQSAQKLSRWRIAGVQGKKGEENGERYTPPNYEDRTALPGRFKGPNTAFNSGRPSFNYGEVVFFSHDCNGSFRH